MKHQTRLLSCLFVLLSRLLNSSPDQTESESWRVGGLSVDNKSMTTEVILGDGDSQATSQGGQQRDKPAEVYGALANSGPGRRGSPKGEVEEGVLMGLDGWHPGHENYVLQHGNEYLSSPRTGKDSVCSIKGGEVDFYALSTPSREGQKVSEDYSADRSPDSDKSTGGDSSILAADKGATAQRSSKFSSGEGGMEAVEFQTGQSPGRVFALFRRDTAKQHTMVCFISVCSKQVLSAFVFYSTKQNFAVLVHNLY